MNPNILPPRMGKIVGQNLGVATGQGEEQLNSNLLNYAKKTTSFHILLVRMGLGKYI